MKIRLFTLLCVLTWCLAAVPAPVFSQAASAGNEGIAIDFKDIDLPDLIQTMSELTGRNYIYDETVRGKVTIISPRRMSLDEAYRVFLTVLNVKGYTVVPSGSVYRVVAIQNAKESTLPTILPDRWRDPSDQFVTQLVPLQNIDATEVATSVLAPLMPKTSNVIPYAPSNTLIISDTAANIDRLLKIINQLDVPGTADTLEVISLEYANAEEVAALVTQFIAQRVTTQPRRRTAAAAAAAAAAGASDGSKVIPFKPTNVLVVMAGKEDLETIRHLVRRLDQKPSQVRSGIQVYYLENADAETLAKTLNEILTGIKSQARTAPTARVAQPGQPIGEPTLQAVSITADKPTNSLIINSTPEEFDTIRDIIAQLDIKRKQVYVEALILELSMDATQRLGASLQGAVSTGSDSVIFGTSHLNTGPAGLGDLSAVGNTGVPNLLTRTIDGILLGGIFSPITVKGPDGNDISVPALSALIDLSKTDTDINILSAPRLLTSDNEEAEIIVGRNVPIITSRLTDTGASTGLAQSVSVERRDVALTLRFTPQITEGNLVRLNVFQESTDIAQQSVGDVNQVGPTFTKRQLRNTVLAENGRTIVLGGLIDSNVQERISKVPLLGDIPVLGWLFKRKSTTETKTNLLVFITPHIVQSANDLAALTSKAKTDMDRFQADDRSLRENQARMAQENLNIQPPAPPEALPLVHPEPLGN
ncbi:type II secretion system secretin GspD [Geoalkalibacter sp.]|uniref:type II secretion system secretin GspD n=1 Tax=Geoalkalibacter sp. TaxID=3041440 RepID=UPI00272E4627|nr:type II secretion system secretin GspD [Geoalkalibacter sp.]